MSCINRLFLVRLSFGVEYSLQICSVSIAHHFMHAAGVSASPKTTLWKVWECGKLTKLKQIDKPIVDLSAYEARIRTYRTRVTPFLIAP